MKHFIINEHEAKIGSSLGWFLKMGLPNKTHLVFLLCAWKSQPWAFELHETCLVVTVMTFLISERFFYSCY